MKLRVLPNLITLARIALVAPIAWLLWHMRYPEALLLTVIAGLSDAVDGYLARRFNWLSPMGAMLDPIADKLLAVMLFVVFTLQGHLPLWLALIVIGRDLLILAGAGIYRIWFGELDVAPTFISKANTAAQIVVLAGLLVGLSGVSIVANLVDPWGFYALAALAVASGVDYVITWSGKAARESRSRRT